MASRSHRVALLVAIASILSIDLWLLADHTAERLRTGGTTDRLGTSGARMRGEIRPLQDFVASHRGKPFRRPVEVRLADDATVTALAAALPAPRSGAEGLLVGMGLGEAAQPLEAHHVLGFYNTATKQLIVRGTELTWPVKRIVVHELAHAWRDQHTELKPSDLSSDGLAAFEALVEGDAMEVEQAWLASLAPEERRAALAEEPEVDVGADVPVGRSFAYVVGRALVERLLAAGGPALLEQAYHLPPRSTEQVIHPERYETGDVPVPVATPPAEGPSAGEDTLGELGLLALLRGSDEPSRVRAMGEGWGGDRLVRWWRGSERCFRLRLLMDTPADLAEVEDGLRAWAGWHGSATVVRHPALVDLAACGPARPAPAVRRSATTTTAPASEPSPHPLVGEATPPPRPPPPAPPTTSGRPPRPAPSLAPTLPPVPSR